MGGHHRGETAPGWLARVDADGTRHTAATGVRLSNGITWSPDATRMYYVDTPTRRIDVFDYDLDTGKAANRRMFAEITGTDGVPDGMCADTDGGVWVALFRGERSDATPRTAGWTARSPSPPR